VFEIKIIKISIRFRPPHQCQDSVILRYSKGYAVVVFRPPKRVLLVQLYLSFGYFLYQFSTGKEGLMSVITARTIQSISPKLNPYFIRDSKLKGFVIKVNPSGKLNFVIEVWHDGRSVRRPLRR